MIFYAIVDGFLPALFWLWFWLQEDRLHPEPRGRIIAAFLVGMLAVAVAYPLEQATLGYFGFGTRAVVIWAVIEEVLKFAACYFVVLRTSDYREPVDALEYLITTALGFSAVENTLFLMSPFVQGNIALGLVSGNMRFIGASLVHVVSSAALGYMIGRKFYAPKRLPKALAALIGLVLASALHATFNYFIIYQSGINVFIIFSFVWAAAIFLLILFEKIKKLKTPGAQTS